ncbi:MAG: hypothetical protein SFY56_04760 [Bacteroidota bacterium]|nr:hypothetical protein [Bacteroidota bacterium]
MRIKTISAILIATFLISSCSQSNQSESNSQAGLAHKELSSISSESDSLGPIIMTIDFKLKANGEDLKTFEDGYIPWISVDNPSEELKNLIDADKIILPFTVVNIIIDYPLNFPAIFEMSTIDQGFTRKQLISEISEKYHEIYKLEETTATTKTIPRDKRKGLINRNQTDGKFGVWGHDISDLDLSQIEVHKNSNGKITLTLGIES